jgi:ATP-dependent helicase/nuclease subunit A
VNFVFETIMSAQFGEIDYDEDQRLSPARFFLDREARGGTGRARPLLRAAARGRLEARPGADGGRHIARRIRAMLDGGCLVTDSASGALRPVTPADIVILMRSSPGRWAALSGP